MSIQIPEEVLSTLTCSECHKYLSVPPVRVYPNRQMKCGRCVTDDDNGVESPHFALVTRYMIFPCTNRYEGCNELLDISEVQDHETTCMGSITLCFCPFCGKQYPSGYNLYWHLCECHVEFQLKSREFLLEIDKGDKRQLFFYIRNSLLCFVTCHFFTKAYKLFLDIATMQNNKIATTGQELRQQFQLFSIDYVKSVCTTDVRKCSKLGSDPIGFEIFLSKQAYSKDVVMCKFNLIDEQLLSVTPDNVIIDPRMISVKTDCIFKNAFNLLQGKKIQCKNFIVSNIKFGCFLEMTFNNFQPRSVLSMFLHCLDKDASFSYRVKVKASLINTCNQPNIDQVSDITIHQNAKVGMIWDLVKEEVNILKLLEKDGFIKNSCLKMELRIKVESQNVSKKRKIV